MTLLASIPKARLVREARHYLYRHDWPLFAREQLKIRTKEGGEVIPLDIRNRPGQQRWYEATKRQLDDEGFARQIWFKGRQCGGSTLASGLVHAKCVLNKNTNALIIAHDKDTAREVFVMHQTFHQHLDPSIRPMVKHDTIEGLVYDNPDSKDALTNPGLNSRTFIATAKNIHSGVGRTLHAGHLSEVARYEKPEELQSAIFDAVPMKYQTLLILESAAFYNPMTSWFKTMCDDVRKERRYTPWRFTFVGAQHDPDCTLPLRDGEKLDYSKEERELLKLDGVTPEFIKWRRYKVAEFAENGGLERFQQSYPVSYEEAWIIPGTNLLTSQTLKTLKEQVRPPIFQGTIHAFDPGNGGWFSTEAEGPLKVWEWPQPGEAYDQAWDVCAGVGQTYTVGTVLRRRGKVQVASWRDNTINPGAPLVQVAKWLGLAYNTAQVAIESNPGNPGFYTNAELGKVYPNLFIWKNYSKIASKILTKDTGWDTTPNSKVFLISTMIDWLTGGKAEIRDEQLWKELTTFRKYSDRHYEAIPGELDDSVMSFAIALRASIDETVEGWDGPPVEVKTETILKDPAFYDRNWDQIVRKSSYADGFERALAEQEAWE
jgi:hypothetical protein